ncbi:hypothetical protein [Photobacterium sp.]|uniref:hypothetical protein n=1 Tax=Photobacterium sp. TaxID=660 RepID=UPI00299DCB7C|nr:hypothetical protein [Photobacterium sp.]MDX1303013.1 hypothetical protein [Photobacterium sp.]
MKKVILLNMFLSTFISVFSYASTVSPSGAFGILTVDNMTQGQLFWLKGRVGEASYTFTRQDEKTCIVKVPVAVGSISEPDLSISETKGLTIIVMSQRLNDALMQGERINSKDWNFTTQEDDDNIDGVIASGMSLKEDFVLNSKRRWISWFMGSKQSQACL